MNRVLITPLDWGLGHATRCIPVIRELVSRGCTVFIAGNGDSLALLQHEFPSLRYFELPGYNPTYPSSGSMIAKMALQIPKFIDVIKQEHSVVNSIVQNNKIELIISDNRYGCWSAKVPSIFMTHQLNIRIPKGYALLSKVINYFNRKLISNFSTCWIPDYQGEQNLSGELSAVKKKESIRYAHIGPLSRFKYVNGTNGEFDVVCVLSGPEPQRSIFEDKVISQLKASGLRYFLVRGIVSNTSETRSKAVGFLNSEDLQSVISKSALVIARSGYSTIMDLVALRKNAIVVPTPGQTEQEYLAERWSKRGILQTMTQENFNLEAAMKESWRFKGFTNAIGETRNLLQDELDRILIPTASSVFVK